MFFKMSCAGFSQSKRTSLQNHWAFEVKSQMNGLASLKLCSRKYVVANGRISTDLLSQNAMRAVNSAMYLLYVVRLMLSVNSIDTVN